MNTERMFRDRKNRRSGWALRNTPLTVVKRFNRPLTSTNDTLVSLRVAVGLGLTAFRATPTGLRAAATIPKLAACFSSVGRKMMQRLKLTPRRALAALPDATPNRPKSGEGAASKGRHLALTPSCVLFDGPDAALSGAVTHLSPPGTVFQSWLVCDKRHKPHPHLRQPHPLQRLRRQPEQQLWLLLQPSQSQEL